MLVALHVFLLRSNLACAPAARETHRVLPNSRCASVPTAYPQTTPATTCSFASGHDATPPKCATTAPAPAPERMRRNRTKRCSLRCMCSFCGLTLELTGARRKGPERSEGPPLGVRV